MEAIYFLNRTLGGKRGSLKTMCHKDVTISTPGKQKCLYLNQLPQSGPPFLGSKSNRGFWILHPGNRGFVSGFCHCDKSWQWNWQSTRRVIAFSSNFMIIVGNPALWQSVQTSENGAGIMSFESHSIGRYSLTSESLIMRVEWIYIPFFGCIFVQQSLQFSVAWKCNYR